MPDLRPRRGFRARVSRWLRARGGAWSRAGVLSRATVAVQDEDSGHRQRVLTPIAEVEDRQRVALFGTLHSVTYAPLSASPQVSATLYDGTSTIELRWPGRRDIPGLHVGMHVEVEGVAGKQGGHLTIINPLYQLVTMENR